MRIFWVSDAVWHPTGYGVTSAYICQRLAEDGHKVFNYAPGAVHGGRAEVAPNLTVLSSNYGDDRWGNATLGYLLNEFQPDLIITWLDCQGLVEYGWSEIPVFMWTPVDTWPIPQHEASILGRARRLLVPSRWGQAVLENQEFEADYVPCGIDLDHFTIDAEGRARWRKQLRPEIDDDTFLIGMVGLNTGMPDRKGYGFAFDALKSFFERHDDARAYIHTNANGDNGAIDLEELRREMGLLDKIYFSRPTHGLGDTGLYMRDMFNAFDVMLHASGTEGFGMPLVEAQACGTQVVANAATSVTELLGSRCIPVEPLTSMLVTTSTRIALPSVENMIAGLEEAYARWKSGQVDREDVRAGVLHYDQKAIYDELWRPIVESAPPRWKFTDVPRKLMLGAGNAQRDGFHHHDRELLAPHIDSAHDLNVFPYPWADDSWDFIEMSDVMEHLRGDIVHVMDELWRILAPGGHIYIHTAEEGSWQLAMDPTHVKGFRLESFDYFDPETRRGGFYTYSDKQWKVLLRTVDNAGLSFVLTPRKGEPEQVERTLEVVEV